MAEIYTTEQDEDASINVRHWILAAFIAVIMFVILFGGILLINYFAPGIFRSILPKVHFKPSIGPFRQATRRASAVTVPPVSVPSILRNACSSQSCSSLADLMNSTISTKSDSCMNFYKYVCGALTIDSCSLRQRLEEELAVREIMTLMSKRAPKTPTTEAIAFYEACVGGKSEKDIQALRYFEAKYGLIVANNTYFNPLDIMLKLASTMQNGILIYIDVNVVTEPRQHTKNVGVRLGISPILVRWIRQKEKYENETVAYRNLISDVLSLIWTREYGDDEDFLLARKKVESTEAAVHRALAAALKTDVEFEDTTIIIEDLWKYSQYLTGDRLVRHLNMRWNQTSLLSYTLKDKITITGQGVLTFLDSILNTIDVGALTLYLTWETTRQMAPFVSTNIFVQQQRHRCYLSMQRFFGDNAGLAPVVLRTLTSSAKQTATEIFLQVRNVSASVIERSPAPDDAGRKRLAQTAHWLRNMTISVVVSESDNKLMEKSGPSSGLSGSSFLENYLNVAATAWQRKKKLAAAELLQWDWDAVPNYDSSTNVLRVPATELFPPFFSPEGHPATNIATLGISMSQEIWRALHDTEIGRLKAKDVHSLAEFHSRKTRCIRRRGGSLETHDVFQAVAMGSVVEAFGSLRRKQKGETQEEWKRSLQLLFIASCLPDCVGSGSRTTFGRDQERKAASLCNVATMNVPTFAKAFECSDAVHPNTTSPFCDF
ncbi:uncharacterized protein LOC135387375 [Ornithodoros turicata]|uniref:uncharacterized protein LOC135387375 n=1 Tax=Ornithodoros turicata TaxID=34597 RepID=UPI003139331B